MAALSLGAGNGWEEFGNSRRFTSERTVEDEVLEIEVLQQATPQMAYWFLF
jgi:hypothetical protein